MPIELNKAFVNDPLTFAKKLPVVAPGSTARDEHIKTWKDEPKEFKGVPGKLRIIAGDLNNYSGVHASLELNYNAVAEKIEKGWMALYYLPWLEGNHVRTTLRPRKEKWAAEKLTVTNGYQADVNDPDIFFTAAVNGCMVSVTGPLDEPVVYHSNAALASPIPIGSKDDPRVAHMAKGLQQFMNDKGKTPRSTAEVQKVQTVTADLYMPRERQEALLGKGKVATNETTKVEDKKLIGAIFGKRRDGKWTFYYERLVQYELFALGTQKQMNFLTGMKEDVTDFFMRASGYRLDDGEVHEFWPGGSGKVLFA